MDFVFRIFRLWEIDVERLIAGELGVVPLGVLGRFGLSRINETTPEQRDRDTPK